MIKLIIKGSLPNLNNYIDACRNNKYGAASLKKMVEHKLIFEFKAQLKEPLKEKYHIQIKWYERDRKRDPDNIAFAKKFILDALVKGGLLRNDGWNEIAGFTDEFYVDKSKPRIEVYIKEVQNAQGKQKT